MGSGTCQYWTVLCGTMKGGGFNIGKLPAPLHYVLYIALNKSTQRGLGLSSIVQ